MYQDRTTFHVASPDIQLAETSLWTFYDPIMTLQCPCLDTLAPSPLPLLQTLLWEWWSIIAITHIHLQFQMQLKREKNQMLINCVHFLFFIIYIQSRDFPTPRISKQTTYLKDLLACRCFCIYKLCFVLDGTSSNCAKVHVKWCQFLYYPYN